MTREKNNDHPHEAYIETVDRLEPNIHPIDPAAGWGSVAISMKRIADAMQSAMAIPTAHLGKPPDLDFIKPGIPAQDVKVSDEEAEAAKRHRRMLDEAEAPFPVTRYRRKGGIQALEWTQKAKEEVGGYRTLHKEEWVDLRAPAWIVAAFSEGHLSFDGGTFGPSGGALLLDSIEVPFGHWIVRESNRYLSCVTGERFHELYERVLPE